MLLIVGFILVCTCTTPVPLAARVIPTLVSPDAVIVGAPPVAALANVTEKIEEEALVVFEKALENVMPHVEVRSRRIGGATFQIPHPVREDRRVSLGMKWMIEAARKRNEKTMDAKLSAEFIAAYKEEGTAYKKKQDTHRMAEANKAFSHFRF